MGIIRNGGSALDAACAATEVLENAEITNAGFGSNLSADGIVECDAGVMDSATQQFGSVGAVRGIRNPVVVAKQLCVQQSKGYLPLGRVPPSFLVGDGAVAWAKKQGIPVVSDQEMISERAIRLHNVYTSKLDNYHRQNTKRLKLERPECPDEQDDGVTDTVGVVCMDKKNNVAATVSSGGIAIKQPGRIGQAAMYGCGCWADTDNRYIAVTTSGCGEQLVKTFLARETAQELNTCACPIEGLKKVINDRFLDSKFLEGVTQKLCGVMAVTMDPADSTGEFLWGHTTQTMCVAYMSGDDEKPTSRISRLPPNCPDGSTVVIEGTSF